MATHQTVTERHVDELLEALEHLLAVPELLYFEELFDETHEAILRADVVRRGIRDELADMADQE